jgi:hypothetical protein
MKRALRSIVEWRSGKIRGKIIHIHGTADRIISPQRIAPDFWITGGSHFMIYSEAGEVSEII